MNGFHMRIALYIFRFFLLNVFFLNIGFLKIFNCFSFSCLFSKVRREQNFVGGHTRVKLFSDHLGDQVHHETNFGYI